MIVHHKYGASGRYQRKRCPGSVRAQADYPNIAGPSAIDGTHTHKLIEQCIDHGVIDPYNFIGDTLTDEYGEFVVDQTRADRARVCIDYVKSQTADEYCTVYSELKVDPSYLVGRQDMGGTLDIAIEKGESRELIDYKDGMNDTHESAKDQLEQYGVSYLAKFKIPRGKPYPFTHVKLTIIQPKLAIKGKNPIISWVVSTDYLVDQVVGELVGEVARCEELIPELIPGELQCRYCRHKTCSKRFSDSMDKLNLIPMMDISQQAANHDPVIMTDEQLSQILEAEPLITTLIKAAKEEAEKRLKSGGNVPGFKLVKGRGSRAWSLSEDEIADKLKKMGIPKDCIYESKLISPAKAEKLTWEKKGAKTQLSARQIKTLNTEYVTNMDGKPTIAPISDERPAISYTAESLFSSVSVSSEEATGSAVLSTSESTENVTQNNEVNVLPAWLS